MTTTSRHHHGRHCSHRVFGLRERGALAYLYWPTFVAVLLSTANLPLGA
jgi:hypothetical protein